MPRGLPWVAAAWLGALALLAAAAPWLPMDSPAHMDLLERAAAPSAAHWLGTDALGRDLLSRLIHGARVSLLVGLAAPLMGLAVGGTLGLVAGYFRGRVETLIVAATDIVLAFPGLVLVLILPIYLGRAVPNIALALGVLAVPGFARVARAQSLTITQGEFVLSARGLGAGELRILFRHVLPNMWVPLATYWLLLVAVAIVLEGGLSFLGLGVPQPTPSWGSMIAEGREQLEDHPLISLAPAAALFLTVLSINVLGEALRQRSSAPAPL